MKILNLLKSKFNSKWPLLTDKSRFYHISKRFFPSEHKCNDPSHDHHHDTPQVESIKNLLKDIQTEEGKNIVVNFG